MAILVTAAPAMLITSSRLTATLVAPVATEEIVIVAEKVLAVGFYCLIAYCSCCCNRGAGIVGDVTLRDSKHCQHYQKALLTRTVYLRCR